MMPIGPLMIEHRLIERMVVQMQLELEHIKAGKNLDPVFVDQAVDFFRFFTDRTHHGKEEDILFRQLVEKPLTAEHRAIMNKLVEEHVMARELVGELMLGKDRHLKGDPGGIKCVTEALNALCKLYPEHIATEDHQFFKPSMEYFAEDEREDMLHAFGEFDRKMIRKRYTAMAEELEERRGTTAK